ncbi:MULTISPECIES: AMP-binding protein [unclassified Mycobacterium]|uniref:class I adenylate-forming enzyme family protein n=1 Tax=unclassified Mycobacterium TaxID=2642494 RepID=UPI00048AF749|nr:MULTISPECIES: AMP-binding protein [unclassified Mycobacterium]SEA35219.1 Acyl-CoA synthetase (AMP-forming)/AMP-acid ligase II [Mycobacterium sp. 283mftsu]
MADGAVLAFDQREYSRPELDALAGGMAAVLADRGVGVADRVALMSSTRPEFVIALHAIWRLGAAAVLLSPAWRRAEVQHALAVTAPSCAVGDSAVLADLMPMLHLDEPIAAKDSPAGTPAPDSDAVLAFSSGTTGMPKAVRHSHRGLAAAVRQWRAALGLSAADRLQVMTPPSHILGLLNIMTVLDAGAWIRLHPRFDVEAMLRHIETDRITIEMTVAPIALALAAHPRLETYDLSSLRYLMWCATPVTATVAEEITRRTGVGWVTAYGTTELVVIACDDLTGGRLDTVGRPVPGVDVRIAESGEIEVRSEAVMAGYLPAEETSTVIVDGWFHTGDIGHFDESGRLRITDRRKEMIKVRGFQVAPAEIEAVLHSHPAVADCAVFGLPDARDGETVVAAVATNSAVTDGELMDLVGARLASYKRPSRVVFVPEIPRLPSGKVLRRVLKERLWTSV